MKKRLFIYLVVLTLLLGLTGCKAEDTTLSALLPRENVTQATVEFLNVGVGENIPKSTYSVEEAEATALLDALYGAVPITVEIPVSYSPELNASHKLLLTTSAGTMSLYYDDYQNIINVPINRNVDDQAVRVYLSFQPTGLTELLTQWQAALPEPEPEVPQDTTGFPPDDSALRATVDSTLFDLPSTEIAFEPASYLRESQGAVYYAFGYHEKNELPNNRVLVVAVPAATDGRQTQIERIVQNDYYIMITVSFAELAQGETLVDTAVLCERADIDVGKTLVFVDDTGNILYTQTLSIPGEISDTIDPEAVLGDETAETPSDAAGGSVGSDEPLQP